MRAVCARLAPVSVFFWIAVVITSGSAGGAALLASRFRGKSLGLRGGLSAGRRALFVMLLSLSWGGAGASGARRRSVGWIGLLAAG